MEQSNIRRNMRQARRKLNNQQLYIAAKKMAALARHYSPLWQARKIALYHAAYGEISPHLLRYQLQNNKPQTRCFYPYINDYQRGKMQFFTDQHGSRINHLGIREPLNIGPATPLHKMDIILLPLVAFDRQGNRLGMGGGFYDRALAFRQHSIQRPRLIGLAHHFQEVKSLKPQVWDIPLDAILSDQELIEF